MAPTRNKISLAVAGAVSTAMALSACGGSGSAADDGAVELNIAHVWPESSPVNDAALAMAEAINEQSGGSLEARVFPAGQLGGDVEINEGLVNGNQDCAFVNHTTAGIDPRLGVGFLPYIVSTYDEADEIFYGDGLIAEQNTDVLKEHGVIALAYFENDFRAISNNRRSVQSPSDLEGLKIRLPEIDVLLDTFKTWGAQPLAMPLPELYTALQQGTVDGQDNGVVLTVDSKFQEVQNHVTLTNHVYGAGVIACSEATWEGLDAEQQEALTAAAEEASLQQREANRGSVDDSIQELESAGVEVVELSPEQVEEFREAGLAVWDEYEDVYGAELLAELRAAQE